MTISPWIRILCAVLVGILLSSEARGQRHSFQLGDSVFLLDQKPFQILSGELHYTRIPEDYWKDRLHKAKAMGLNTVAVYCMWNAHEPQPGHWVFSGNEDVARFVKLAQQQGLWVILRPGPYVCAEWEFGGYPWWLLNEKGLVVRSREPHFMARARAYLLALGKRLAPLQITHGGPILMVQVENEYGSYGTDTLYERQIAHDLRDAGFNVPFYTADGDWLFKNAALPGILPAANGEGDPVRLKHLVNQYHGGKGPYFVSELYPGWLDHWGEPFQQVATAKVVAETRRLLDAGVSINFYMWHGGTNFGFMNGANYNKTRPIQPDITSYDYDAPLSEAGVPTEKYKALRQLLAHYQQPGTKLPPVPAPPAFISIDSIPLSRASDLWELLDGPLVSATTRDKDPLAMETLGQGYGYTLYRTTLEKSGKGLLKIGGLRDYARIFMDGRYLGTLNRMYHIDSLEVSGHQGARLDILVENLGRINYGAELPLGHKGITGEVTFRGRVLHQWIMYSLPFKTVDKLSLGPNTQGTAGTGTGTPTVYQGSFRLEKTADTFLDMRRWGKGVVFVNGHNLGRFWRIGPQQTLYVPGCWLRAGTNQITVWDMAGGTHTRISSLDHPILDQLSLAHHD